MNIFRKKVIKKSIFTCYFLKLYFHSLFCNNNKIIGYNWIKLFNVCNALTESKKKYNIYIHFVAETKGPFIYVDNKMIYFNKKNIVYKENTSNIIKDLKIGNKYTEKRDGTTFKYILVSFLIYNFQKYCIFYDYSDSENSNYFAIEIDESIVNKLSNFKIHNSKNNLNINREIFHPMNVMYGLMDNFIDLSKLSQLQFFYNFFDIIMFQYEEPNEPIQIKTMEEINRSKEYRKKILNEYKKTIVPKSVNNTKNLFGNVVSNVFLIPKRTNNNYIPSGKNEKGLSNDNQLTHNQLKTLYQQNLNKKSIQLSPHNTTSVKGILKKNI